MHLSSLLHISQGDRQGISVFSWTGKRKIYQLGDVGKHRLRLVAYCPPLTFLSLSDDGKIS